MYFVHRTKLVSFAFCIIYLMRADIVLAVIFADIHALQPINDIFEGSSIAFRCEHDGPSEATSITWTLNGNMIREDNSTFTIIFDLDNDIGYLSIKNIKGSNRGDEIKCNAIDGTQTVSSTILTIGNILPSDMATTEDMVSTSDMLPRGCLGYSSSAGSLRKNELTFMLPFLFYYFMLGK